MDLVAIQQRVEIFCSKTDLSLLQRGQTKPNDVSFQAFKEYYILSKPANFFERFLVGHARSWFSEVVRRQTSFH